MTLDHWTTVVARRGRTWHLEPGLYCYVGSARGPGGLRARLRRHCSDPARKHWHIDHLARHTRVEGFLVVESLERLECGWAAWLQNRADETVDGFGSSDCTCPGHLFRLGESSDGSELRAAARAGLGARFATPDQVRNDR
jgi:Uri superfamily endonuclease